MRMEDQLKPEANTAPVLSEKSGSEGRSAEPLFASEKPRTFFSDKRWNRVFLIAGIVVAIFVLGMEGIFLLKKRNQALNPLSVSQTEVSKKRDGAIPMVSSENTFAKFVSEKTPYRAQLPEYSIGLSEISNLKNMESPKADEGKSDWKSGSPFSGAQKSALTSQNFFVRKNGISFYDIDPNSLGGREDDWTEWYQEIGGYSPVWERYPENSVFVSSDYLLHVYHRLLEKEFEYIEQTQFYPTLLRMTDTALEEASKARAGTSPSLTEKRESFDRVSAYFAVPASILHSVSEYAASQSVEDAPIDTKEAALVELQKFQVKMGQERFEAAKQELEYIFGASQIVKSPLFGTYASEIGLDFPEDYTQYGPRSHYAKNPVLRSYFRVMMWYGRQNFFLKSPELTRDAANITSIFANASLEKDWRSIYGPTAFFVGESDDLMVSDYAKAMAEVSNGDAFPFTQESLMALQKNLEEKRNPAIMSSVVTGDAVFGSTKSELKNKTKGFRLMGQRFTPDAFIFSTLTQGDEAPDPGTGEKLPSMPTALMVMSVFGSDRSSTILDSWVDKNAPDSRKIIKKQMNELEVTMSALPEEAWSQNIYWGWISTLKTLFQEKKDLAGFPVFMRQSLWRDKDLRTSLGSWTELKHDTLLYAKQSYAEMGGGGDDFPPLPVPKGYVEPNIEFFDRLIPLAKMTRDGLKNADILDNEFEWRNAQLIEALEFFRKIAVSELADETISDEDFEKLRLLPGRLSSILSPLPGEQQTEDKGRSALIADVHTDASKGAILYEATGIPDFLYVAVKDKNGTRLTKGLVYSYYEFSGPLDKRLTDKDWRAKVYSNGKETLPSEPEWSAALSLP